MKALNDGWQSERAPVVVCGGRVLGLEGGRPLILRGVGPHAGREVGLGSRGDRFDVRVSGGARAIGLGPGMGTDHEGVVLLGREPVLLAQRHILRDAAGETRASWLSWGGFIGADPGSHGLWQALAQAADSEAAVWLHGASGTGKERAARLIHDLGPRSKRPFVALNCAALPESLVDAELFGVARGAFTGADRDRPGVFQQADGGTLFLDEVGELSPASQARLLRVLEVGEVARVGAARTERVDVRVVAASWRDLEREAEHGRFRHDLLHRLWVLRVDLPSLAARPLDVPALIAATLAARDALHLLPERAELRQLCHLPWSGNVRQLLNQVARAVATDDPRHLGDRLREQGQDVATRRRRGSHLEGREAELRRELALGGSSVRAAARLGVSRSTLYRWLGALGLDPRAVREGGPAGPDGAGGAGVRRPDGVRPLIEA